MATVHARVGSSAKSNHLVYADALRTAAILLVIMNHLVLTTRPVFAHRELTLAYLGIWGVNCFFVLSGFLLGPPYLRALVEGGPIPSPAAFYRRRFLRIYPLYFIAVAASIAVTLLLPANRDITGGVVSHVTIADVVSHFLLLQGLSTQTVTSLNGPLWTMGIDAGFYLLLPLCALGLRPLLQGRTRPGRIGVIAASLGTVGLACLAFRYVAFETHPSAVSDFAVAVVFARNLVGFAASFALGTGVALAAVAGLRVPRGVALAAALGGALLALLEFATLLVVGSTQGMSSLVRLTLVDPVAAVSSACMLFGAAELRSDFLARTASASFVVVAAGLAYAAYLFHWPLVELIEFAWLHGARGNYPLVELTLATFVLLLPLTYLAHRFIEEPFLILKSRSY